MQSEALPSYADVVQRLAEARVNRTESHIKRLDHCAGLIEASRTRLGEALYCELVSQAYAYALFLTNCKSQNIPLTDVRVREPVREVSLFCEFLETDLA
ncbi:Uncharacterised protein [Achromobacter sp. 2789STDY5608633]|jgi:hypothetical protein|uniref:hypothetical protein n=1 Tax=Achromobacter sp. 2789STDY5608633 TaxID=1806501 RepID=UPI0006BF577D|nr:hypothetical protein [Achromobacter sp. 2789STDY5608633]CUJ69229.1 Uncharacterised protein [Achromobacter sp. 2789STDY5608633]